VVVLKVLLQRLVIGEVGPARGAGRLRAGIGGELDEGAVPGIAVLTKEPQGLVVDFSDFEEALAELKHAVIDPKGDRGIEGVTEADHGVGIHALWGNFLPSLVATELLLSCY
jgi:hypothetical protein